MLSLKNKVKIYYLLDLKFYTSNSNYSKNLNNALINSAKYVCVIQIFQNVIFAE